MLPPARRRTNGAVEGSTASAVLLKPPLGYAALHGVDIDAVLRSVSLPREALDDFDRRVPTAILSRVWTEVPKVADDPDFGLHVAERSSARDYDVLGYAFHFSGTLGDGLDRLTRFYRVLGDQLASELIVEGPICHLRHLFTTPRHETEALLAAIAVCARSLVLTPAELREVRFTHPAPASTVHHADVFRAPVRFDCARSEILLGTADLALPLKSADVAVSRILDRHMTDILARLPRSESVVERVRAAIAEQLRSGSGKPSLTVTAKPLRASPRTVQRWLREHGTSHTELVDGVRREMAERMVADRRLSITEMTFLLGYSDVSGFRRAYERWTGRARIG
jgi:AraC-like DNA-binding protein